MALLPRMSTFLLLFAFTLSFRYLAKSMKSPEERHNVQVTEGIIPWTSDVGGSYQTFYKLFGSIAHSSRRALIVLHGGPGLSSDYLSPFADLANYYDTPVIIYDQLGNARSTHLDNKPPSFWTVDIFVQELTHLIEFFKIQHSFDLAGHSWGSVLGMEFAQRTQPSGLEHLVLSDGLASSELWNESQEQLSDKMPAWIGGGLSAGFSDPASFEEALRAFYAVYGIRIHPPPDDYNATLAWIFGPHADPTVASSPIMDGWTIINRLSTIKAKTLVINSQYDIAQDFVIQPLVTNIPRAKWIKLWNASHIPFWEQRSTYMAAVNDFLRD